MKVAGRRWSNPDFSWAPLTCTFTFSLPDHPPFASSLDALQDSEVPSHRGGPDRHPSPQAGCDGHREERGNWSLRA